MNDADEIIAFTQSFDGCQDCVASADKELDLSLIMKQKCRNKADLERLIAQSQRVRQTQKMVRA